MLRLFQRTFLALAMAGMVHSASAFSLTGPFATWETAALGYSPGGVGFDIGGPMNLGEGYRWNVKTMTYGFTKSFQDYFGQRGIDEVNKAFAILNGLPPVSRMSQTLSEFPQDTRGINMQAFSLGLFDLKTEALGLLINQLGVADSTRYVWTLRSRATPAGATNYVVVMRNFDPVTWNPSPYVNGVLYTYTIGEFGPVVRFTDAVESTVDPLALGFNTASHIDLNGNINIPAGYFPGVYYTGLTRDDVGGLRYLLSKKLLNVENLPTNIIGGASSPWMPVGVLATNTIVRIAMRPGVDKIAFKQLKYYGFFPGFTNVYTDVYVVNGHSFSQRVQDVQILQPDIVFTAGDFGVDGNGGIPFLTSRTPAAAWANNSNIQDNTPAVGEVDGPGVVQPTIIIGFSNVGPYLANSFPGFMNQFNPASSFGGWAAFDGSANPPFIFPNGASIQDLQNSILNGGGL